MRKLLTLLIAGILLALSLSACGGETPEKAKQSRLTREEVEAEADFENAEFYTAENGDIYLAATALAPMSTIVSDPESIWTAEHSAHVPAFTMPEDVQMEDGSLGVLRISSIGLAVNIFETDDEMESMKNGVAHFKHSSAWNGNICLAGHNRGTNTFFGKLHTLKVGDTLVVETALGTRTYQVQTSKTIDEMDWSMLGRTETNMVTMITCIDNQPTKRLCVQAVEVTQ